MQEANVHRFAPNIDSDMKTRMYLGAAAEDRLGWASHPPSTSEERENFEEMCTAWAEYEHRIASGATVRGRAFSKRNSSPVPPVSRQSDLDEEDPDATVRGRADPRSIHHAHSQSHFISTVEADRLAHRTSAPSRKLARPMTAGSTPLSSIPSSRLSEPEQESPPSSRTGRIFVAWKA